MNSTPTTGITKDALTALLARVRQRKAAENSSYPAEPQLCTTATSPTIAEPLPPLLAAPSPPEPPVEQPPEPTIAVDGIGMHGEAITYNKEQQQFIRLALSGENCILIGAAGCGKTTAVRGAVAELIRSGRAGILQPHGHKHLHEEGTPGIVAVSYTRRAVANLRKAMPSELQGNTITIHKLLEYQPVYYTLIDEASGEEKQTMRFEATRHSARPLPSSIRTIIIDESSMVSVELFKELQNALPHNCQYVFLGDIQQLPPVFGSAILGFKMLELTTIELTQVYRQALESPIIRLAHQILSGVPIPVEKYEEWKIPNQLTLHPWKKKLSADLATATLAKFLTTAIGSGIYDPEEDMVLIPFNKACGTEELNKHIAGFLAKQSGKEVYEVVAGFNKLYFHVGARVLYEKEDAIITAISRNGTYLGHAAKHHSLTLDYWGHDHDPSKVITDEDMSEDAIDFLLDQAASLTGSADERVRQASHILTLQMLDSEEEVTVESAAELNKLLLGYALTIHKSQGSEFRKVFLLLHQSHATMIQRELLYTGVTRAREELYIICEPDTFTKGIINQRIKGETLAQKAIFFQGKLDANGNY